MNSWTVGPNWPAGGEIDIIEGVNLQTQNQMTMHTSDGCSLAGSSCLSNQGCSAYGGAFGDSFNQGKGGTYAMEWTGDAIKIWFFARGQEPKDILGDSPDPNTWANPASTFQGGSNCDMDAHFKDQQILFDTTFCGDWAGSQWSNDNTCSAKASTCEEYVKSNPKAFSEAYWTINALKVYTSDASSDSSPPPQQPEPSSPAAMPVPQPSNTTSSSVPTVTSYTDGGPITMTVGPDFRITKTMTNEPVTMTLTRCAPIPQDKQFHHGDSPQAGKNSEWSSSWSSSESRERRRRRLRARRHLAEHLGSDSGHRP